MPFYEHVVIARPDISGQQAEALLEEMKGILAENGGNVSKTEYWGLRNLAYRIRKHRKGHYGLLNIEASSDAIQELERRLKIHDDVIRFLSIRWKSSMLANQRRCSVGAMIATTWRRPLR